MIWRPEWIESAGGPLLFLPNVAIASWHGAGSSTSGARSDYERACAIEAEVDVIQVGTAQALVLGDEPDRTAIRQFSSSRVFVLRWRWAQSEESLLSELDWIKLDQAPATNERTFETLECQYLLFDSAASGQEIDEALRVEMKAGTCFFDTFEFRPNPDTFALIHRLRVREESK